MLSFPFIAPPYLSLAEQYGRELTQLATATRPHLTIIVGFLPRIQVMYGARSKINMLQKSQAPPSKEDLLLRRTESHPKKVCITMEDMIENRTICITNWGNKKDETQTSSSYGSEFSIHSFIFDTYGDGCGWPVGNCLAIRSVCIACPCIAYTSVCAYMDLDTR